MTEINAKQNLKIEMISKLIQSNCIKVIFENSESKTLKNDDFITYFLSDDILMNIHSDVEEIIFETNDLKITTTGLDIRWWNGNTRRKNKMKKEVMNNQPIVKATYSFAIALMNESGKVSNIKSIVATKEDIIQFINENISKYKIDSMLKTKIVLNFTYSDTSTIDDWFEFDDLIEKGILLI